MVNVLTAGSSASDFKADRRPGLHVHHAVIGIEVVQETHLFVAGGGSASTADGSNRSAAAVFQPPKHLGDGFGLLASACPAGVVLHPVQRDARKRL